jgi:hypothetical protein
MLKMAARASGIGLAVCGLALALAPAAGASTVKPAPPLPVTQSISFPTSFGITSPCNGSAVSTSGKGSAVTFTKGQRTTAILIDNESGDGYQFIEFGTGTFSSLSSTYTVHAEGTWINLKDRAESFHSPLTVTLYVTSSNAPAGYVSNPTAFKCGV